MEKILWISLLYDFYGRLLTEKQRKFIELYYNNDLSLGEIALECSVTRQAVYDILKRSEKTLNNYEGKLGLVSKFMEERNKREKALMLLKKFREDNDINCIDKLEKILKG